MNFEEYFSAPKTERPLDRIVTDGGFCGIFRTIGCVGDSLSSGEFESMTEDGTRGFHDMFEYSWGQYLARDVGCKVYNFSRGGMSAKWYMEAFADENDYWNPEFACQAYIIALGVNDLICAKVKDPGSVSDICAEDYTKNSKNFAGYYAQIIQRLKTIQPKAKFFLMTMPHDGVNDEIIDAHAKLLHDMAAFFDSTYVIDLAAYAPVYDADFKAKYYLGGHLSPAGYIMTARVVESYMDYLIRHNPGDFKQVPFYGKDYHNVSAPW